ncbi:MAG: hypothetical protein HQ500_02360 [Flavobacteriales bacterium]|nr:hypothetical protein [Flavobacteriales bacterium]
MDRYKIIKKGLFQSLDNFQEHVNGMAAEGWRVVSSSADNATLYVILERQR